MRQSPQSAAQGDWLSGSQIVQLQPAEENHRLILLGDVVLQQEDNTSALPIRTNPRCVITWLTVPYYLVHC